MLVKAKQYWIGLAILFVVIVTAITLGLQARQKSSKSNDNIFENENENSNIPFPSPELDENVLISTSPAPTAQLTLLPSDLPSQMPSQTPTISPTTHPTQYPTKNPTQNPTQNPTNSPTNHVTYRPGFLNVNMVGLLLSEGLTARIIAESGKPVEYYNGDSSDIPFHDLPDAGDIFVDLRESNPGGWIYASNSEVQIPGEGGVGSITFNSDGEIIDYQMVLTGSTHNCGGGRTPWNTWVSCEELFSDETGQGSGEIYQVDPSGERAAEVTKVGEGLGRFESFTYDVRDMDQPRFFASEDRRRGAVRRFTPTNPNWEDPWTMLHGEGTLDYLELTPSDEGAANGTFKWIDDLQTAKINAQHNYPECEGIDVEGKLMYLVSKRWKALWIFDLDEQTWERFSTEYGTFDGHPDQVQQVLADESDEDTILYFTEEGGEHAGVHGRNRLGQFFTILEGPDYKDETVGLAFSPDGMHMIVAYQDNGVLIDVTREDGQPFHGRTLNVKYHHSEL